MDDTDDSLEDKKKTSQPRPPWELVDDDEEDSLDHQSIDSNVEKTDADLMGHEQDPEEEENISLISSHSQEPSHLECEKPVAAAEGEYVQHPRKREKALKDEKRRERKLEQKQLSAEWRGLLRQRAKEAWARTSQEGESMSLAALLVGQAIITGHKLVTVSHGWHGVDFATGWSRKIALDVFLSYCSTEVGAETGDRVNEIEADCEVSVEGSEAGFLGDEEGKRMTMWDLRCFVEDSKLRAMYLPESREGKRLSRTLTAEKLCHAVFGSDSIEMIGFDQFFAVLVEIGKRLEDICSQPGSDDGRPNEAFLNQTRLRVLPVGADGSFSAQPAEQHSSTHSATSIPGLRGLDAVMRDVLTPLHLFQQRQICRAGIRDVLLTDPRILLLLSRYLPNTWRVFCHYRNKPLSSPRANKSTTTVVIGHMQLAAFERIPDTDRAHWPPPFVPFSSSQQPLSPVSKISSSLPSRSRPGQVATSSPSSALQRLASPRSGPHSPRRPKLSHSLPTKANRKTPLSSSSTSPATTWSPQTSASRYRRSQPSKSVHMQPLQTSTEPPTRAPTPTPRTNSYTLSFDQLLTCAEDYGIVPSVCSASAVSRLFTAFTSRKHSHTTSTGVSSNDQEIKDGITFFDFVEIFARIGDQGLKQSSFASLYPSVLSRVAAVFVDSTWGLADPKKLKTVDLYNSKQASSN